MPEFDYQRFHVVDASGKSGDRAFDDLRAWLAERGQDSWEVSGYAVTPSGNGETHHVIFSRGRPTTE